MANLITEAIALFAAMLVILIAYVSFAPLIDSVLQSMVLNALSGYAPDSALAINANALVLTNNIVIMGFKVFCWLAAFSACARFFIWVGWRTEQVGV